MASAAIGVMLYSLSVAAAEKLGIATASLLSDPVLPAPDRLASGCISSHSQSKEDDWDLVCLPFLESAEFTGLVGELTYSTWCCLLSSAATTESQKAGQGRAGQSRAGQGRAGQGRAREGSCKYHHYNMTRMTISSATCSVQECVYTRLDAAQTLAPSCLTLLSVPLLHASSPPTWHVLFLTSANNTDSTLSSLCHLVAQLGSRTCCKEGNMSLQATRHVFVDSHTVLPHAMVSHTGPKHGVPGPVLQQQPVLLDVNHSGHVLIPACAAATGLYWHKHALVLASSVVAYRDHMTWVRCTHQSMGRNEGELQRDKSKVNQHAPHAKGALGW